MKQDRESGKKTSMVERIKRKLNELQNTIPFFLVRKHFCQFDGEKTKKKAQILARFSQISYIGLFNAAWRTAE